MYRVLIVSGLLLLSGCASTSTAPRPEGNYSPSMASARSTEMDPLFNGDESVISDDDIKRILDHPYVFPKQSRIAILPLSQRTSRSAWSTEFAAMNSENQQSYISALRASSRVFDASFLPSILVPEKRTVPYLREAAARYQADLMLLYRTDCKAFEKYKLFSPNETKAFCTVEAVLLDTRTGIIPFTAVTNEVFEAKKTEQDLNFSETVHKAEIDAIGKALLATAKKLLEFIDATAK